MSKTMKVVTIVVTAIVLGVVGYLVFDRSGILAALLAWLAPNVLEKKKREGAVEQYNAQSEAAAKAKAKLAEQHAAIDAKTEVDVAAIITESEERQKTPPTQADEDEMRRRFGGGR
jgi:hypothetical protein